MLAMAFWFVRLPVLPLITLRLAGHLYLMKRTLYNLAAILEKSGNGVPGNGVPLPYYAKIEKVLKNDVRGKFQRRGIYLSWKQAENFDIPTAGMSNNAAYTALFKYFLENGFLIPPSPAEPLILPFEMSKGEEAKLAGLFT